MTEGVVTPGRGGPGPVGGADESPGAVVAKGGGAGAVTLRGLGTVRVVGVRDARGAVGVRDGEETILRVIGRVAGAETGRGRQWVAAGARADRRERGDEVAAGVKVVGGCGASSRGSRGRSRLRAVSCFVVGVIGHAVTGCAGQWIAGRGRRGTVGNGAGVGGCDESSVLVVVVEGRLVERGEGWVGTVWRARDHERRGPTERAIRVIGRGRTGRE